MKYQNSIKFQSAVAQAEIDFNLHKGIPDMHQWDNAQRRAWILDRANDIVEQSDRAHDKFVDDCYNADYDRELGE